MAAIIPRYVGARHPLFNPVKGAETNIRKGAQLLYYENGSVTFGGTPKQEPVIYTISKLVKVTGSKNTFYPGALESRLNNAVTKEGFNKRLDLLVESAGTIGFLVDLWEDLVSPEQYTIEGIFNQEGHALYEVPFKATPDIKIIFGGGIIAHPAIFKDPQNSGVTGRALAFDTYSFGLAQEPIDELIRGK